ncbi:MAG TPA: response regulator [Anaeromyxobacteraceae bacterium]|nr:response regulator [Anaeromyxobacteraceae bacterium]
MSDERIPVLVVDDDFMIAQLHARCVEQEPGFAVAGVAHTCKQALAMARQLRPTLVVLDVYLPDRPGLEVARGIRAANLPCDFILITAAREVSVIEEAFRLGMFEYLIKPFRLDLLGGTLRKYREFRAHLRSSTDPDQGFVEGLKSLRGARAAPPEEPRPAPKGIDARTLERVAQILRALAAPSGAEQVAQRAGVSRSTARAYLNHLVKLGDADELLQYGAVGRPQVLFRAKR